MKKKAIIIGAGPAGLTAAYELLLRSDIEPIIIEKSRDIGGLCKTVNHHGNRMDIGGHRFFSKSDRVMKWWLNILPLQNQQGQDISIRYHQQSRALDTTAYPTSTNPDDDKVMLVRNRLSRIFYLKKFFAYPLSLSVDTIRKLGFIKLFRIGVSYSMSRMFPRKQERTLEDFFINRFGRELYRTFFKDYTEKVWGVPCHTIPAEWGAQRVKGLSIGKAILHAAQNWVPGKKDESISQKNKQTSLIERFLYPKFGPGQLWEEVARIVVAKGGKIHYGMDVTMIDHDHSSIKSVTAVNDETGAATVFEGDYFFSSMPVSELIGGFYPKPPAEVSTIAQQLQYRDFITVGLLLKKLKVKNESGGLIRDSWIYMQDRSVKIGRLQVFNNWSPFMVKDPGTVWLGLEYFCRVGDELWSMSDEQFMQFAIDELAGIDFIDKADVLDHTIVRMEKTYPAYFGAYERFDVIRKYTDGFPNLFLVGRNGMHKYNNSDHSMLTAMTAVDNILEGVTSKDNIWAINTEQEYHETQEHVEEA
ncbi:MAG TPA: NAD(P)/FAD-dependent oxidoreductase [Chitinophagaceae bacterium]|nr:NAD(P)/FAD-dependent oxidoreductase [Chitinophagaceae bacterium]